MYEKVKSTISKYSMVSPGDKIVVGVSGGPDSVVLAHTLAKLAGEEGFYLHIAHLNHMFRGHEADLDAESVARLAEQLDIPYTIEKIDVPKYLGEHRLSAQKGAREVRYSFFNRVMENIQANKVATGHHADDQAETVLINLLRGAGLAGLSGIPPVREGVFIRPLFEVSREEINRYCEKNNLPVRYDRSNEKIIYLRNKIRKELLPYLQKEYNPKITTALVRLSDISRDDDYFISTETEKAWDMVVEKERPGELVLNLYGFIELPRAIQRRIIIRAWGRINRSERDLGYAHVEQLLEFLRNGPSTGWFELPKGIRVRKLYGGVKIFKGDLQEITDFEYELKVPGVTMVPELGIEVVIDLLPEDKREDVFREDHDKSFVYVDYNILPGRLTVRNRRPGDRFQPLGMKGIKKLKDFFIDLKILAEERDLFPIITAGNEIVSIGKLRLDERWKVSAATKEILRIKIIHKMES